MAEHDLEKLLGAFAADTLTPEERRQLYTAALQDQRLFDALADEQALKELLADPSVRRRLLDALERPTPAKDGGAGSWIDWFRRPANLALAGGLATAVFAVVLGTKIYQDSLTQSARSGASETATPAAPSSSTPATTPPQEPIGQAVPESTSQTDKKESIRGSTSTGPPTTQSRVPQTSDAAPERERAQPVPAPVSEEKRAEVQSIVPDKAAENLAASTDGSVAVRPAPPTALSESTSKPATAPAARSAASATGARALFYAGRDRSDAGAPAQDTERTKNSSGESDAQSSLFKRKLEGFSSLRGKAAPTPPKPLALRYNLIALTADGQKQPLDHVAAANGTASLQIILEANQESYLQIWEGVGSTTPRLLIPQPDSGQISMKLRPGQRPPLPLPGKGTFLIRLARAPFGPITKQEAALLDRPAIGQLQETVAAPMPTGQEESATYVATTDLSAPIQILLDLAPHR